MIDSRMINLIDIRSPHPQEVFITNEHGEVIGIKRYKGRHLIYREFYNGEKEFYNKDGSVHRVIFADGTEEIYNNNGICITRKFINGAVDRFDDKGNKISSKFSDNHTEYYDNGIVEKIRNRNGHVVKNMTKTTVVDIDINIDELNYLFDIFEIR